MLQTNTNDFKARRLQALAIGAILGCTTMTAAQTPPSRGAEPGGTNRQVADWQLVRTLDPRGGPDRVSIMRTADINVSDLGLAGLTIRCGRGGTQDWLVIVLEPFSPQAKPQVTLGRPPLVFQSDSTVSAPGTALLLPDEARSWLLKNPNRPGDLPISVAFGGGVIQGSIRLGALDEALALLTSQCP